MLGDEDTGRCGFTCSHPSHLGLNKVIEGWSPCACEVDASLLHHITASPQTLCPRCFLGKPSFLDNILDWIKKKVQEVCHVSTVVRSWSKGSLVQYPILLGIMFRNPYTSILPNCEFSTAVLSWFGEPYMFDRLISVPWYSDKQWG